MKQNGFCAHYADNQWQRDHTTVNTITDAKQWFASIVDELGRYADVHSTQATLDLYAPKCNDCSTSEVHHDYPHRRYVIGRRGAIRQERI
jgi:hypothetical protein